jgi:hypothetical protein
LTQILLNKEEREAAEKRMWLADERTGIGDGMMNHETREIHEKKKEECAGRDARTTMIEEQF